MRMILCLEPELYATPCCAGVYLQKEQDVYIRTYIGTYICIDVDCETAILHLDMCVHHVLIKGILCEYSQVPSNWTPLTRYVKYFHQHCTCICHETNRGTADLQCTVVPGSLVPFAHRTLQSLM